MQAEEDASIANAEAAALVGEKDVEDIIAEDVAQASEAEIVPQLVETEAQ